MDENDLSSLIDVPPDWDVHQETGFQEDVLDHMYAKYFNSKSNIVGFVSYIFRFSTINNQKGILFVHVNRVKCQVGS